MATVDEFYQSLNASHRFSEIRRRYQAFPEVRPDVRLIDLAIGDVTCPPLSAVTHALHKATDEMARADGTAVRLNALWQGRVAIKPDGPVGRTQSRGS